jgi:hypothetical protein
LEKRRERKVQKRELEAMMAIEKAAASTKIEQEPSSEPMSSNIDANESVAPATVAMTAAVTRSNNSNNEVSNTTSMDDSAVEITKEEKSLFIKIKKSFSRFNFKKLQKLAVSNSSANQEISPDAGMVVV